MSSQADRDEDRPASVKELYDDLVAAGYTGSYKAVLRYVRRLRSSGPSGESRPNREPRPRSSGGVTRLHIGELGGVELLARS